MADIMVDSVTTGIDLNETKAVEAINRLKSAVKDSTREWQINEAQAKSAGDAVSASKYRYEGLSEAMEKQKAYIANLSEGMKTINRDTDAGEKAYQKYNAQLTTAERSLASMTGQLNRAKSAYEYQQTGIEDLNKSLSANDKLMQSQIDLYEKTRNKMGAAKAEVSGLSTSYAKQTEIYRAQVTELKRLESAEGTSSETLVKQKTRVNEAASSLLNYRNKLLEANLAVTKMQPFNSESLIGKGLNTVYQTTEKATDVMAAGYQKVKNAAYQSAFGIAAIGAAAIKGSQMAADLQDSYIRTTNLAVTGGEKVAEVTKNVAQMQKDGAQYSVEYGKSQKEIAEGYQELIKRGYTSTEALGAMRSELQASVASGDDFNNVLSVTSQVVDAYGMRTDNAAQMTKNTKDVVNQLAYAADMTATDFASMGKAMEYVGDSSHSAGFQLSEASSAIGILSNHGLEADKAGTGLRKVINSITGALSDQSASQEDAAKSESALNEKIAEHQKKLEEAQAVVNSGTGNTKAVKGHAKM
ncbi:Phage tail length tape-measure protein [Lactococcus cremoris]|uniref:phage tail tape measure protein n=1 Tax=Lactococcus lactis subsp. cremoris TaxID=1359 RepID=UPI0007B26871|nr:phage tail tape measure protein [Lactococcus cremoris]KZK13601.1 Phage tail length tape-measure protein [Lactococcus cremoris]